MKRELGDQDARPRQAPARSRRAPADGLLPADRRRGAAGRADRDRDQGDARTVRGDRRRGPAGGEEDPEIARGAPYTTPVRRLERRAPPAIRSCVNSSRSRSGSVDQAISQRAAELAPRALAELEQLVGISTPFGDVAAAERAFELCRSVLPAASTFERPPCSTDGLRARPDRPDPRQRLRPSAAPGPRRYGDLARGPPSARTRTASDSTAPARPT